MLGNQLEGEAVGDGAAGRVKGKVAFVTGMQLRVDAGGYLKWYDCHN
jgi:hypothetical protein